MTYCVIYSYKATGKIWQMTPLLLWDNATPLKDLGQTKHISSSFFEKVKKNSRLKKTNSSLLVFSSLPSYLKLPFAVRWTFILSNYFSTKRFTTFQFGKIVQLSLHHCNK